MKAWYGQTLTASLVLAATSACAGGGAGGSATGPAPGDGPARFTLGDRLEREVAPFEIVGPEGEAYTFPLLGGFEVPRPHFADIDGDGDFDLFIQKYSGSLMYFENVGSATSPAYAWRTSRWHGLEVGEWARFHDADGDGDLDLFHELPSSYMRYVENVGSASEPRLHTVNDSVRVTNGQALFADAQNLPWFHDIDCDGAFDVFLGRIDGTVSRYEFDSFRGEVPAFTLVAERFENIEIVAEFAVTGEAPDAPTARHGANSMAFADWDDDGDPDLFWGDFFEAGLLLIENIGSCERPNLDVDPVLVPADREVLTSGYNAPALEDLDGDGHLDLVMGVLGGAFNANRSAADNLFHYRGTEGGRFAFVTDRFLDQLDIGSDAVPAFGDLDGDGDLDLLIGSRLDPESSGAPPLHHYENVGTRSAPRFAFAGTLDGVAFTNSAPELVDLDADGDLDLLVGSFNRDIRWFRNDGTPTAPHFVAASDAPLVDLTRGSYATPTTGDLDGDGDLDLIGGESSGEINHYANVGSPTAPRFELVTDNLAGIDAGSRSAPTLVDLDGEGDLDLVVGNERGEFIVYRNRGTRAVPDFESEGTRLGDLTPLGDAMMRLAQPRFVDIDADGDLDLVVGDQGGGLLFFRNRAY
ncbi:MAG: VCBS repeat-containing protein [Longimicrobiales bacterium]|nr:VCBS repeat-containing protein [Longimicrobiales bacterium]